MPAGLLDSRFSLSQGSWCCSKAPATLVLVDTASEEQKHDSHKQDYKGETDESAFEKQQKK